MEFTAEFLWNLGAVLLQVLPLFSCLALIIAMLSIAIGRLERWSVGDSLYFGFITALTVGYGDLRPTTGINKVLAIVIALFGLIMSGILVAIAVEVLSMTFKARAR